MDNAAVHVSQKVKKFLITSKVKAITITPYSPTLNPCEKLINAIKQRIKKKYETGQ